MPLKHFVKINAVTNLSDARYCSGMMVDQLGFNFEKGTEQNIDVDTFKSIAGWVAGVDFVGEFGQTDEQEIMDTVSETGLQIIQTSRLDLIDTLVKSGLKIILKINNISQLPNNSFSKIDPADISYVMVSGRVEISNYSNLLLMADRFKLVRDMGYEHEGIDSLDTYWHGLAFNSTPEDKPGFKEYGILMEVLEFLDTDL